MSIIERIESIQQIIRQVESSCLRPPGSVELLAVSKGHTSQDIVRAFEAGPCNFGENYVQEALVKIQSLTALNLNWHFIGAVQSNKAQIITQNFAWAHGICRIKIAQILNDERPPFLPKLNVCIQVNIDNSETKSGIKPEFAAELAAQITRLPRLHLRGLMVIPQPTSDEQQQYLTYLQVTDLLHRLNSQLNLSMDTLSMGMSNDLSAAIRAGSTMVRIGRGIFGERI